MKADTRLDADVIGQELATRKSASQGASILLVESETLTIARRRTN